MKKLLSLLLTFLLLLNPVVLAEESNEVDPGTTPDSPLWGLERAMERISLALTFGKAAKAKKGLMHARERLAEVKAMIEAKRLEQAEKAQEAHDDIMDDVQEDIDDISEEPEQELEDEVEVEKELTEHDADLADLEDNVNVKIIGTLTQEQQERLDALLVSLEGTTDKVRIMVNAKRDRTKIKMKTKLGMTDDEVEEAEEEAEEEVNLEDLREKLVTQQITRIERKITKLRTLAANAEEKGKDVSTLIQRLDDAESLLNQVKEAGDRSLKELKEAVHEINKLLNFRKVFMAIRSDKIEAQLAKLDARLEATKEKAEAKVAAIERARERLQQRLTQTPEGDLVVEPEEPEEPEESGQGNQNQAGQ